MKKIHANSFILVFILLCFFLAASEAQNSTNVPQDMIFIKGGRIKIGSESGADNEKPVFNTDIAPYYLDKNPVTVAQFRLFVKINRYISDAEKKGEAAVYDVNTGQWQIVKGADWQYPLGRSHSPAQNNEPVRQISWNDAKAYANWIGKRLPTEFELEYAANNAQRLGINGVDGSLWQWCDNWYFRYDENSYYKKNRLHEEKSLKGGKYELKAGETSPYRASMRTSAIPETAAINVGFRCAKDIE